MSSPLKDNSFEPRVSVNERGMLTNGRYETLAMLLAEGFTNAEAWKAMGGETKASKRYGRRIFANAEFKKRVEALMAEKSALEQDEVWGEAAWAVNQAYRLALVEQDIKVLMEATKMKITVAEKIAASRAPPPELEPAAQRRGPGAPTAESMNTRRLGVSEIREQLMAKNRELPSEEEPDESGPIH